MIFKNTQSTQQLQRHHGLGAGGLRNIEHLVEPSDHDGIGRFGYVPLTKLFRTRVERRLKRDAKFAQSMADESARDHIDRLHRQTEAAIERQRDYSEKAKTYTRGIRVRNPRDFGRIDTEQRRA